MSAKTSIEWTDATWNIARGCDKVDADCKFCYMYRDSFNGTRYKPREVVRTKTVFDAPLRWKEPRKIFTSSLTDVFHPDIDPYRGEMWDIIRRCPQHTFQILTKRPERIAEHLPDFRHELYFRVWLGTSVGHLYGMQRMYDLLVNRPGKHFNIYFLSLEPLHGEIFLDLKMLNESFYYHLPNWVIIGGESGNETGKYRYRECRLEWIEFIVYQCREFGIPVFIKQMGTHLAKKLNMSDRHGKNIDEFPEHLRIREFPNLKM